MLAIYNTQEQIENVQSWHTMYKNNGTIIQGNACTTYGIMEVAKNKHSSNTTACVEGPNNVGTSCHTAGIPMVTAAKIHIVTHVG